MKKKKITDLSDLGGLVYSTNPDQQLYEEPEEIEELSNSDQNLVVRTDKKNRKGKVVTLIQNFEGPESAFSDLAKKLKTLCGTGGSVKDGEIIIQGDNKIRISDYLKKEGYKVKVIG
ncbi:MAG: translation initiation factor [Bacteroidetes bacterium]|nr:translation initiation factor [Bacteroidota bacterium]